jgi:hypothetical protein
MNTITETKKIYLTPSGAQKTDSLYSNLTFNIPTLFSRDKFLLYNTIKILHCEIPYSWYLVNEYNDKLVLSTGTILITRGSNYNANSFITEIQSKLPTNMTITFNSMTGKFSLSYTSPFSILSSTTCTKILGCDAKTTYVSISNTINLPYLCNFLGTKNLYINIPNLSLDNFNSATKTYSTLLCIAVTVSPFGIIFYENITSNRNIIKGVKDDTLEIQILDDEFNQIDFNHTEWSITLEIETVRQILYIQPQSLNS